MYAIRSYYDGEDQAAHDEDHDRVHIGCPRGLDIRDSEGHQRHTNTDGGDFQRNRLGYKQEDQYRQNGQKPLGFGGKTVFIVHACFFQTEFSGFCR